MWLCVVSSVSLAADLPSCEEAGVERYGRVDRMQQEERGVLSMARSLPNASIQRGGRVHTGLERAMEICIGDAVTTGPTDHVHVVSRNHDQQVIEPDTTLTFTGEFSLRQAGGAVLYYLGHPYRVLMGETELINEGTRFLADGSAEDVYVSEGKLRSAGSDEILQRGEGGHIESEELVPWDEETAAIQADKLAKRERVVGRILRPPRLVLGVDLVGGAILTPETALGVMGPRIRVDVAPFRYLGITGALAFAGDVDSNPRPANHMNAQIGAGVRFFGIGLWANFDMVMLQTLGETPETRTLAVRAGLGATARYTYWISKHLGISGHVRFSGMPDGRPNELPKQGFFSLDGGVGLAWGW